MDDMNRIFQNIDYLSLPIEQESGVIFFPKDRLYYGKMIKRIFVLDGDGTKKTPTGEVVAQVGSGCVCLNLYDTDGAQVTHKLSSGVLQPSFVQDIVINRTLDWSLCQFEYRDLAASEIGRYLSVVVEYSDRNYQPSREPLCFASFTVPATVQKAVSLYDIVGDFLSGRTVVRIDGEQTSNEYYLTIRDRHGKVFNEIPGELLANSTPGMSRPEPNLFDCLNIDMRNTYINTPNGLSTPLTLTFFYC